MKALALIASATALAFAATASPVAAATGTLLDTLTVDTSNPTAVTGTAQLTPGVEYTIQVSGAFTITSNEGNAGYTADNDALFCYDDNAAAHNCTPPFHNEDFSVGVGGDRFDALDHFQRAGSPELPYHSDHTYEASFFAPVAGVLKAAEYDATVGCVAQNKPCGSHTNAGVVTVKLFGPARTGGGGGSGTASAPPVVTASGWNQPVMTPQIAAGGAVIVNSPRLGRKQKKADVSLGGQLVSGLEIGLAPLTRRERLLSCVGMYEDAREQEVNQLYGLMPGDPSKLLFVKVAKGDDTLALLRLSACLEALRNLSASENGVVKAAASGCGAFSFPLTFRAKGTKATAHIIKKSKIKRGQPGPLRATCTVGPNGIVLHVSARKGTLRSALGSRLPIGLRVPANAASPGQASVSFTQP